MSDEQTALVPRAATPAEVSVWDPQSFEHMGRVAKMMAHAGVLPKHLRGTSSNPEIRAKETIANCFLVVSWAARMGLDPWGTAAESYVVHGNLGWQGKLVAAVINSRAGLKSSLRYEFNDEDKNGVVVRTPKSLDDLEVTVIGHLKDEDVPRKVTIRLGDVKTDNDMWKTYPKCKQKLCYTGAIWWARRHTPEITLGVLTDDDLERIAERKEGGWLPPAPAKAVAAPKEPSEEDLEKAAIDAAAEAEAATPTEPASKPEAKGEQAVEPEVVEPTVDTKAPFDLDSIRDAARSVMDKDDEARMAFWHLALQRATTKAEAKQVGKLLADFEDTDSAVRVGLTPDYRKRLEELA